MSTILITGAAGFIGSHLMSELKKMHMVSGLDILNSSNIASLKRVDYFGEILKKDICSEFLDDVKEKPEIVIHLAAETGISGSLSNPALYFHQNVEGTFNVLEQCRKNNVKYFIYASSSSVYSPCQSVMNENSDTSNQLSFYGTTKKMVELMVENYCRQYNMIGVGFRFFTVYGSWTRPDMAAYKFMKAIQSGQPINLYNQGDVSRDFTHVSDIVSSISQVVLKMQGELAGTHKIFNIGYGKPISVKSYAELIAKNLDAKPIFKFSELPPNELPATFSDSSSLFNYINFKPICSPDRGIKEMTDWFKDYSYE